MPNITIRDLKDNLAPRWMPWLAALLMAAVYLFTLNHWVTVSNILSVSRISGFFWQPDYSSPLFHLATLPFRWLPAAQTPVALNLFSVLCAAVTLGLLARCAAILPHDRTEMERTREKSDFAYLTTGSAWIPPLLAVTLLGMQSGFWENATNFTGEMLYLLHFAIIVWLLLEYRLDERPGRLHLAAFLYAAGLADNWALVGFFPVFITALIWLKGLQFFNLGFLVRMTLWGLAGMSLFLVMPILSLFASDPSLSFWGVLKPSLQLEWQVMKLIKIPEFRRDILIMSSTTLLPIVLIGIRWSATFGDNSRLGSALANYMFHAVHAVCFGVSVWLMFDPPFSPSALNKFGPALPLYFLNAIGLAYFAGYYLLVFGKKAVPSRRNPRPFAALPGPLDILSPVIFWTTCGAIGLIAYTLCYKNLPQIRSHNDDTLKRYAQLTEKTLPPEGAILLCDPEVHTSTQQTRALLMQAALARSGRARDYLVLDTASLNNAAYFRHLQNKAPGKWPRLVGEKDSGGVHPLGILGALDSISKSNTLCYLNPSFGYYFELFYQEPHGLSYEMKRLPEDTLLPPPLPPAIIALNNKFWAEFSGSEIDRLVKAINPPKPGDKKNLPNWIITRFHGEPRPNPNAVLVANLYARTLDYWGVELQKSSRLAEAAVCFSNALRLNPENIAARVNLEHNLALQSGTNRPASFIGEDQLGKFRDWNSLLNTTGPFDDPSYILTSTFHLAQGGYTAAAIAQLARARQLSPNDLAIRLSLAQLYLQRRLHNAALEALSDPLLHPQQFGLNETNATPVNLLTAAACFQQTNISKAVAILDREAALHPNNRELITVVAQSYFTQGLHTNALNLFIRQLTLQPDDPTWLSGQGQAYLQTSNYVQAIHSFNRILQITNNEPNARFNRAYAYLQSDLLDEARADYLALQSELTNSFPIAYALGEIAWRQHNTNEAIRNYEVFLANAPTNAVEINLIRERMKQMQNK